ncbi:hypothetical protein TESG_08257 [Trichophyton tonsurans CBS 112818]|uniref:Uncharacterized protein n=1 Tax=Trichophyton tonsurans (strain CBS 112818) TaxID=647933 RepID=F2RNT0_TRIT1|nr:hypothetical protein TESG_08257 [Trichophyton tonsurans CBS 112818]
MLFTEEKDGNGSGNRPKPTPPVILLSPLDTYIIAKKINTIPPESYYRVLGLQDNATVEDIAATIQNLKVIFDVFGDTATPIYKEAIENAQKGLVQAEKHAKAKNKGLARMEDLNAVSEFQHPLGVKYREAHQHIYTSLRALYDGQMNNDTTIIDTAKSQIEGTNNYITMLNKMAENSRDFATVPVNKFITCWQCNVGQSAMLEKLVYDYHLPKGWAENPPQADEGLSQLTHLGMLSSKLLKPI